MDEESKKPNSNEVRSNGQSLSENRQESISVHTVVSRPTNDLSSLIEHPPGPSLDNTAWPTTETTTPTSSNSAFCASAQRYERGLSAVTRHYLRLRLTSRERDDDNIDLYSYKPDKRTYALVISGRDATDDNFTQTCFNDACAVMNVFCEPNGTIPKDNTILIRSTENDTESEIQEIFRHITMRKPVKLFVYYSGHGNSAEVGEPRLDVSDCQGKALDISRVKNFIYDLMPTCQELLVILDSCSAAKYLLLPVLPPNAMPNRIHIQFGSSKQGGISYAGSSNSLFTFYVTSALTLEKGCPNGNENCPICHRLRLSMSHDGCITLTDLMEYVSSHMRNDGDDHFSFHDLPLLMVNPVARE